MPCFSGPDRTKIFRAPSQVALEATKKARSDEERAFALVLGEGTLSLAMPLPNRNLSKVSDRGSLHADWGRIPAAERQIRTKSIVGSRRSTVFPLLGNS